MPPNFNRSEILVWLPCGFSRTGLEVAPLTTREFSNLLAALDVLFVWGVSGVGTGHTANKEVAFVLREVRVGSTEIIFQAVGASLAAATAVLAGSGPTAIANVMACLQALKALQFRVGEFLNGNQPRAKTQKQRKDLERQITRALETLYPIAKRIGRIEIHSNDVTVVISEIDLRKHQRPPRRVPKA